MPFDPGKTRGCAFGNCENASENGGKGCHMCDVVAKLPQPKFRSKGALVEDDVFEAGAADAEETVTAALHGKVAAPPRKPVTTTTTTTKRRPVKGPQTGSLLDYEPD